MGRRGPMSEEIKRRISDAKRGKSFSQEHKDKISLALKENQNARGHSVTEEEKLHISQLKTTHGLSQHRYYQRWYDMMSRCYNSSDPVYKYYGARGIVVCESWHSVSNFIQDLELLTGYVPGHSIDRIDNDGNYEPGNIRWASQKQQVRNSRRVLGVDGV